jgi:hypothetical protein
LQAAVKNEKGVEAMTKAAETNQTRKSSSLRRSLLLLALITSPLLCCGSLFLGWLYLGRLEKKHR